jgi:hypothetical protein
MAKRLQSIGTDRLPVASKASLQRRVKEPVGPPRSRVSAARP